MAVSVYSVVMAMVWFSAAALIGSAALRGTTRNGLIFVAVLIVLALVRILFPLEFPDSIILRSRYLYPILQKLIRQPLIGSFAVGHCLLCVWFLGGVVKLTGLTRKLLCLRSFCNGLQVEPPDSLYAMLAWEVSSTMHYYGEVKVSTSHFANTAYQAGFTQGIILLPANIKDFSEKEIRCMIRHELCHFLGNDLWIKTAMQVISAVLWWNPVMILLNQSVEQMLELRCDQRACGTLPKEERCIYLSTLIHLSRQNKRDQVPLSLNFLGSDEEDRILQRFRLITEEDVQSGAKVKIWTSALICFLLLAASYFITVQPWTPPAYDITPEISHSKIEGIYVLHTAEDGFFLYIDNEPTAVLNQEQLKMEPFCNYTIIEGG